MLSVSLVTVDSYQAKPQLGLDQTFSDFRGTEIRQVPVIRIFGSTSDGKKTCLHVHGAFPYMYVPCTYEENVDSFAYRLAAALDAAINSSLGLANSHKQHVYKVQQVSGIPFYGYHQKKHKFFKIYFYNPAMIKRAADLLQNGAVSNRSLQSYEAHIPFILQFMIDYNLYGMSFVHLDAVKIQRQSHIKDNAIEESTFQAYKEQSNFVSLVTKQTTCQLELDVCISNIINRKSITKGFDLNPGLSTIWDEEKFRRNCAGLENAKSQLLYSQISNRMALCPTASDEYQRKRLIERLQVISQDADNTSLSNPDELSYPVEVANEDYIPNASCVLDHSDMSTVIKKSTKNVECNEGVDLDSTSLLETSQSQSFNETANDTTLFDSEDRDLVEMLVQLAEDNNEMNSQIDKDSVLGTYSSTHENEVESDTENGDTENLNVTTSALMGVSSWDLSDVLTPAGISSDNAAETDLHDTRLNMINSNDKITFPQYDGTDDISFKASHESINLPISCMRQIKRTHDGKLIYSTLHRLPPVSKVKHRKGIGFNNTLLKTSKLDHKDLDVYAVHGIEVTSATRINEESSTCPNILYNSKLLNTEIPISTIPALDGCSCNSDSEPEVDVTTHKREKHRDLYESNMNLSLRNAAEHTTTKKGRYSCEHKELLICSESKDDHAKDKEQILCNKSADTTKLESVSRSSPYYLPTNLIGTTSRIEENIAKTLNIPEMTQVSTSCLRTNFQPNEWRNNFLASEESIENRYKQNSDDGLNEQDVTCNMTFTQQVNQKLCPNGEDLFAGQSDSSKDVKAAIKIATKFNPPSYQRISESMKMYNIPQYRHAKAFYSKRKDTITHKESGEKISSFSVVPFKSSLQDIININVWRRMKVNEFHPSGMNIKSAQMKQALASYKTIKITPLTKPPFLKDVVICNKKTKESTTNFEGEHSNSLAKNISNRDGNDDGVMDSQNIISTRTEDCEKSSENLSLPKSSESLRILGMSYGQIDFSSKSISDCVSGNFQSGRALTAHHYLTILSLEIHVATRDDLLSDPQIDPIEAIFYAIENDGPTSTGVKKNEHGAIVVSRDVCNSKMKTLLSSNTSCPISYVTTEEDLLKELVTLVKRCDADILTGWEIETLSWGYILQRAHCLKYNHFSLSISRIINGASNKHSSQLTDVTNSFDVNVPGRIVLDTWRIMKHELTLLNYTFENVMFNVMHERTPCPNFKTLTSWWRHSSIIMRCRVIEHYIVRVLGTLRIMSHLDIISRSSEHARLFGIQLYEVFSRGSQFRVESMMLRLAKPLNFVPISPSIRQRAKMRAPAALPLIMEPESTLYTEPLIVLDFQSLYPSIIIAYNYCFSTCLGRVEHIGQLDPFEFGAATLRVTKNSALKMQDKITFAPCGVAFIKSELRRGILPRMLEEILNTRLMVKQSMKIHPSDNRSLQRLLDSQQLGLKLIANVTYGYTAANFSGRMPCAEVADSVVSKGRETLERAIKMVESTRKWGAQVVYGDTDSLFLLLPGRSRKEAFDIGMEIADAVTASNPPPVKLKFEKVLHPCILQTKKRYCGYMYETPDQKKPEYLAKGIETVRRDGCPAAAKILEKTLKILFDSKDISLVKSYVIRQLDKVIRKRISIEDLTFAKEFRGINGYKANACVPALELTRRLTKKDPRAVPRQGQRVRYVIIAGAPDEPLFRCVRTPWEVISNPGLTPNSIYYVTKVIIPPLNRCLNLIGIDVNTWYREMTHRSVFDKAIGDRANTNQKVTIYQFFNTVTCIICAEHSVKSICSNCLSQPNEAVIVLHEKMRRLERSYNEINSICLSCTGQVSNNFECASLDCPTLYRVKEAENYLAEIFRIKNIVNGAMDSMINT